MYDRNLKDGQQVGWQEGGRGLNQVDECRNPTEYIQRFDATNTYQLSDDIGEEPTDCTTKFLLIIGAGLVLLKLINKKE